MKKKLIAAATALALGGSVWAADPVYVQPLQPGQGIWLAVPRADLQADGSYSARLNRLLGQLMGEAYMTGGRTGRNDLVTNYFVDQFGSPEFGSSPSDKTIRLEFGAATELPQIAPRSSTGTPTLPKAGPGGTVVIAPVGGDTTPAVTAVTARAFQTYSMYTDPGTGASVPNLQTLVPNTSAAAQVFSSAEASEGTGTTITSAADAAAHIASTQGVYFHTDAATGIYWGYQDGANPDANGMNVDGGKHYIFGPPVTNMPTSGTATYAFLGSTVPSITVANSTSSGSGSGNSFTSGNFTANFSAQTLTTPAMAMNFANNGQIPAMSLNIAAGQTISYGGANTAQNIAITCSGGCTAPVAGNINTRFTGNGASGLAVAITAYGGAVPVTLSNGASITTPLTAAVVAAYKKQ